MPIMVHFQTSYSEKLRWLSCLQDLFTQEHQNQLPLSPERNNALNLCPTYCNQEID